MNAVFDHRETVADHIETFWFKPEKPLQFVAGQFTELYLPHEDADNRGQRRWFTISSPPTAPFIGITTKLAGKYDSTFKKTLAALQPGMAAKLAEPMGDFVLPKDPAIPLVFVAAGIGITPMHSMVAYLAAVHEKRSIHLIYAVRRQEDLAFLPLFQQYGLQLTTIVKQPEPDYHGETGGIDAARIVQMAGINTNTLFYLSGPEAVVEKLTKGLPALGVDKQRIITDYFPGYTQF